MTASLLFAIASSPMSVSSLQTPLGVSHPQSCTSWKPRTEVDWPPISFVTLARHPTAGCDQYGGLRTRVRPVTHDGHDRSKRSEVWRRETMTWGDHAPS